MTRASLIVSTFLLALVTGCGGGASDPFTRTEAQYDGTISAVCRSCPALAGATTESECVANAHAEGSDPFSGEEWECQRRAYQMYPNELGPTYDCVASTVGTWDGCVRRATTTCPPAGEAIAACNDQLNASLRTCPQTDSIAAGTAVSACFM